MRIVEQNPPAARERSILYMAARIKDILSFTNHLCDCVNSED